MHRPTDRGKLTLDEYNPVQAAEALDIDTLMSY